MEDFPMKTWLYVVAVGIGALLFSHSAFAAGSEMEILLKKLQQKGILTAAEADEIVQETRQTAAAEKAAAEKAAAEKIAAAQKAGTRESAVKGSELPEWVKNTKLKGDLRLRYEARDREDDSRGTQGRGRFRLRAGLETTINDEWTAGFGLTGGTGDQRSANQTFTNSFTRKSVWIDYAYARYAPTNWFSALGGKFNNPVWEPYDMLVSNDINPEGVAVKLDRQASDNVGIFFNGGLFVLNDNNGASTGSTADPLLYVFQPGVKWNFTKDTFVKFAPAYYAYANQKNAPALATSSQNGTGTPSQSNTNTLVNGRYKYDYSAINWGGEVGITRPFGTSAIPYLGFMAGYINNPDPSQNNEGYLAGVSLGYQNVQKFGDWSFEYTFRRLEKDAWLDILPESSFYNGNTNVAGHRVKFLFGVAKNTSLGFNFYDTWKLRNFIPTTSLTIPRATRTFSAEELLFQADVIVKF
jgi:hypothetical protein